MDEGRTKSRDFDAPIVVGPDSTMGDKLRAMRLSKRMTLTGVARTSGLSERAIRYIENNERQPGLDVVRKISAALGVEMEFFLNDELFQKELHKEELLAEAQAKYGSRGMAQAMSVYGSARALYAGGTLSEEERETFRNLMMDMFFDSKEEAKKYAARKRRKKASAT